MRKLLIKLMFKIGILSSLRLYFNYLVKQGAPIRIPVIAGLGFENITMSEQWMIQVIEKLLFIRKGTFVDVGINMGQTLIKLKSIDSGVDYVGFEPNPICVFYVKELIKENLFTNVLVIPAGVAEKNELFTLNFYSDGDTDSSASIVENFRPQTIFRQEVVPCYDYKTMQFLLRDREISILKIDVEGAELDVLRSMADMIVRQRPFILVEILPVYTAESVDRMTRQLEIERIAKLNQYIILRIKKVNHQAAGYQAIEKFGITTEIEESDYLMCPSETLEKVLSE